jgi:ATP-dependent exoDNAse (exonuclease V) alpha subunit
VVAALHRAADAADLRRRQGPAGKCLSSDLIFRFGDRILCFSGEIVELAPRMLTLRMDDADGERQVEYPREDWSQLQLAYAITSHRAQGSEWPSVVVVLSQSHYLMLQHNLLYTALTRARQRTVILPRLAFARTRAAANTSTKSVDG